LNIEIVKRAVDAFGFDAGENTSIQLLGNGLINHTFKITDSHHQKSIVLQAINTNVFTRPEDILHNYKLVFDCLGKQANAVLIPAPLIAKTGKLYWIDEQDNFWRASEFINNSYSPIIAADEQSAYTVANSFARFTQALSSLDITKVKEIISRFHDLDFRYRQFEESIKNSSIDLLLKSTHLIAELRQRKKLVDFYNLIKHSPDYPDRVMHHDCKISNILFDKTNGEVICPVDLDTVMPGKYFSDLGDMIRSMACTVDENSTSWEEIDIRNSFYESILEGYLSGIGNIFSAEEKRNIHYSGLILIFMQSLRFAADFLNGDVYYKINYPEQNLNRALNQLILLEKLEDFLKKQYKFDPY